jgi:hypothetical protein
MTIRRPNRLDLIETRWIWPFAIVAIILIAWAVWRPYRERAVRGECRRLYDAASTATDTIGVDAVTPANPNPKFRGMAVMCGDLRKRGRL